MSNMTPQPNIESQIPPNNVGFEAIALGCVMLQGEHQEHWRESSAMVAQLKDALFYDLRHKRILAALNDLDAKKLPLSMVSLAAAVNRGLGPEDAVAERWTDFGGVLYVSQLPDKPAAAAQFEEYRDELYELADRRYVVAAGARANDTSAPLRLPERLTRPTGVQARHVRDIIPKVLDDWESAGQRKGQCSGVRSGLLDLDRKTSGWQNQNLIVIGARPSMGKTAILAGFAIHAALEDRVPTAFFSVESSEIEITKRFACMVSRTDQTRWRDGTASEEDFAALFAANARIRKAPLYIVDCPGAAVAHIAIKARELKATHGIRLICVDYLQKIKPDTREEKRTYEVAQVSEGLKNIAKELQLPVITAAQLNREYEKQKGRAPMIGDLADSAQIEKDADIVGLLYAKDTERQLLIAKFRDGPTGIVRLTFLPHCARFENAARIDRSDLPYRDE